MPRTSVLGRATRVEPTKGDRETLSALPSSTDASTEVVVRTTDGAEIRLPKSLAALVLAAANDLAAGRAVLAIPAEVELTPHEAGDLLGLSRPFVTRLLDQGEIPSVLLPGSSHRRIKLADVLAFQERREHRGEGRRRIADITASAGLPY